MKIKIKIRSFLFGSLLGLITLFTFVTPVSAFSFPFPNLPQLPSLPRLLPLSRFIPFIKPLPTLPAFRSISNPLPSATVTPTSILTITPTNTPPPTPTPSSTPTFTPTPTATLTPTPTPTQTPTSTLTPTETPPVVETPTPTITPTPTVTTAPSFGLVAYWKMEEGTGSTLNDSSGHGYNLSLVGDPLPLWSSETPSTTQIDTQSVSFDGDNYATLASSDNNSAFDFVTGFTLEAWVKAANPQLDSYKGIISKWDGTGYILRLGDGKAGNYINSELDTIWSITNIQEGSNWHHVAATWNGMVKKLYVDGLLEISSSWSAPPQSVNNSFYLASFAPPGFNFLGNIDEAKIYNYALTKTQIVEDAGITGMANVLISEVQIDGGTEEANNNDFIELYNPTDSAVNLDGYRLVQRTGGATTDTNIFTFGSTHIIPAHGYFLWAHKSGSNNYADTISADVFSADTLSANNSIAVRQGGLNTGTIIDALSWDASANSLKEGSEFTPNPSSNQSMERKAAIASTDNTMSSGGIDELNGNSFDTGNNANDFILRTASQPQNNSSPAETP